MVKGRAVRIGEGQGAGIKQDGLPDHSRGNLHPGLEQ